jgi:hypothetical protein
VTLHTLHKRLKEGKFLASTDDKRRRNTIRQTVAGIRKEVLHFLATRLLPVSDTVPIVPIVPNGEKQAENGTISRDDFADASQNRPNKTSQFSAENAAEGAIGTIGTVSGDVKAPSGASEPRRRRRVPVAS